jgi:hypothetical protein
LFNAAGHLNILWTENKPRLQELMKARIILVMTILSFSYFSFAEGNESPSAREVALRSTSEQLTSKISEAGISRFMKEENNVMISFIIDEQDQLQVRGLSCSNPELRALLIESVHGMSLSGTEIIRDQLIRVPLHLNN